MKILLCSHVFPPQVGGIETVSSILADQWTRLGSSVIVVTQAPGGPDSKDYEVIRQPSIAQLRSLANKSDIIFQNNVSLRTLIPLLPTRKPIVVTHQGMIVRENDKRGWREHLKCVLLRFCHNISISEAVAKRIPVKSIVIGNPFESEEFKRPADGAQPKDMVFIGRLVSDKGCELVLRALSILKCEGLSPSFTVIGDGDEMPALKRMTAELKLADQVTFTGVMREGRGTEVGRHKVMVVPSDWEEPFGVVALEGIAAGCAIAASQAGGLPEAVGPCGLLFPRGDVTVLAAGLKELLSDASLRERFQSESRRHLRNFQPEIVAKRYLDFFKAVLNG
jgi:glycogen(starch) synthase